MAVAGAGGGGGPIPRRRRREPTPAQRAQARRSLGFNPAATGIGAEQAKARQRVQRARQTAPPRPVPHVPVIRNPSPRQTQAAKTVIAHAINRQVTGRTPAQKAASRTQIVNEVETDPRLKSFRQASHHYARAEEQQMADAIAKSAGVGGSRSDRIRAGRVIAAQTRRRNPGAHAGAPDRRVGLGPATVSLPGLQRAIAAGTSLDVGDLGPRRFAGRAAADVGSLATGPFIGGYELGAGTYEAVTGKGTSRLQRLGKGVAVSTYDTFRHPIRSFEEHPVLTPLTFAAGAGAVGRVGGAVARGAGSTAEAAGVRGALARAGSTVRPPLSFSGDAATGGLRERSYSKDLTRKAVQVSQDRAREPLLHPDGSPVTVVQRGRTVPVLKASEREREKMGRKQGDFLASRANTAERATRDQVAREMRVRGVRGRSAQDLVAMVTEGTITSSKHFESDLTAYRNMVSGEIRRHEASGDVFHDSRQLADARAAVQRVDRVLGDKRVLRQKDRIVEVGQEIGRKLNESEAEASGLGVLNPKRAARSRLTHPAVLHMGARHFTGKELREAAGISKKDLPHPSQMTPEEKALVHGALRHSDGRFLSNEHIEEALRAKGRDPSTVAYLPPGALGRRAFHARFNLSRPTIGGGETRTGEQFRRGLTTAGAETVREQGTKLAVQVEKARSLDRAVSEHGMKHPNGRYFTGREAEEYAKRLEADTGERLVAVRAVPARAGKRMETLAREQQSPSAMESLGERLLNDRLNVKPGTKNVVLMPASLVERLQAHAAPSGSLVRMGQMLNRPFRAAVLPQPRWLTGNFVEPFIVRLTTKGSGVNVFGLGADLLATSRILKSGDRQVAKLHADGHTAEAAQLRQALKEVRAQQTGSGLFIGGRGASVRRTLEEMPGAKVWGPVIAKTPAVRQMVELTRLLGRGAMAPANLFFKANRTIENVAQRAAFGRSAREDIREFTGSWTKTVTLGRKAADEAARGLVNTSTQRRWMDAQHELLGKYEGYSPTMRALTQTIFPFLPWMLNAARFTFWTMPVHNTVKTALLMKTAEVVQKDWEEIHKDVPPGSLKFAIPNGKGGWIDLARYTPTGAFTEASGGGGYGTFTSQIMPQVSGVVSALEGRDPFGRQLQAPKTAANPEGKANPLTVAANQAIESLVPYIAQARRLREGGGTPFSTSTLLNPQVKPGTKGQMSAFRRTFDPFRPTYLRSPASGSGGGGKALSPADAHDVREAIKSSQLSPADQVDIELAIRAARGGG